MEKMTSKVAFKSSSVLDVPKDVQKAYLYWLLAIAAGIVETIIVVTYSLFKNPNSVDSLINGVVIRVFYTIVVYIIIQMKKGKKWARITLAIGLGVIGTLFLIIEPIRWFLEGNSISEALISADMIFILIICSRLIHLASVLIALVLMLRPSTNSYFK